MVTSIKSCRRMFWGTSWNILGAFHRSRLRGNDGDLVRHSRIEPRATVDRPAWCVRISICDETFTSNEKSALEG